MAANNRTKASYYKPYTPKISTPVKIFIALIAILTIVILITGIQTGALFRAAPISPIDGEPTPPTTRIAPPPPVPTARGDSISVGNNGFVSPNGDGVQDTVSITIYDNNCPRAISPAAVNYHFYVVIGGPGGPYTFNAPTNSCGFRETLDKECERTFPWDAKIRGSPVQGGTYTIEAWCQGIDDPNNPIYNSARFKVDASSSVTVLRQTEYEASSAFTGRACGEFVSSCGGFNCDERRGVSTLRCKDNDDFCVDSRNGACPFRAGFGAINECNDPTDLPQPFGYGICQTITPAPPPTQPPVQPPPPIQEEVCGNGFCRSGETASNCPQDCAIQSNCGNGICENQAGFVPTETRFSCPQDCVTCIGTHISCANFAGDPEECQRHGCFATGPGRLQCTGTPHSCSAFTSKNECQAEAFAGCGVA